MLKKLGKMLVVAVAAASMLFVAVPMAKAGVGPEGYYLKLNGQNAGTTHYFKNGHPAGRSEWEFLGEGNGPPPCGNKCSQKALARAGGNLAEFKFRGYEIQGDLLVPTGDIGAFYGGTSNSKAIASASGKRFAFATAFIVESTTGGMDGFRTGPKRTGTSFLIVGSWAKTQSFGTAIAFGDGYWKTIRVKVRADNRRGWRWVTRRVYVKCPSTTTVKLEGSAIQGSYGSTFTYGPHGENAPPSDPDFAPQAWASGGQQGEMSYESMDFGGNFAIEHASAFAAGGTVLLTNVNPDGTRSEAFGAVGGIGHGEGDFLQYEGSGSVAQGNFASNGSSMAYGSSSASYNASITGQNSLTAGGYGVVHGVSSVVTNGNTTTVMSHQTAVAGTFSLGSPQ